MEPKYFTQQEAADLLGISYKTLNSYLNKNQHIKDKYCKFEKLKKAKPILLISAEGVTVIKLTKNKFQGNQSITPVTEDIQREKVEFVEKVMQKLKEQEERTNMLNVAILEAVRKVTATLENLPVQQQKLLPTPLPAREKSLRAMIRERINVYAVTTGLEHRELWKKLYHEFFYRYETNLPLRAKNRNLSALDVAEEEGMLQDLFDLASQLYQ